MERGGLLDEKLFDEAFIGTGSSTARGDNLFS